MALKIQPQTFKSSYIKLIALFCSLVYSLLLIICLITGVPFLGNLGALIFFGVAYLITTIVYILARNVKNDCNCLKVVWFVDIAYAIGGLSYYVGRNYPFLASLYTFPCNFNSSCLLSLRVAQSILLGMSVLFHRLIPFFISKYYQSNLAKEHQTTEAKLQLVPEWILAAESLTLLVEFDAMYTIMKDAFTPTLVCTLGPQVIGVWLLWAMFIVMYIFILYYTIKIQSYNNCYVSCGCVASYLGAIVVVFAFGLYLLSADLLPISCSAANQIIGLPVMKALVLIVVITVIVLLLVYRCLSKTRQEKLLPHALYQHLHPEPNEQNDLPMDSTITTSDSDKKDTV